MTYDYYKEMEKDIRNYIRNNVNISDFEDAEEFVEKLDNDLWTEDSVTGNGSGSYTFSTEEARRCVAGNEALFVEMAESYGLGANEYKRALQDPEYMDVSIRCYLLNQILWSIADELEKKGTFRSVSHSKKKATKKRCAAKKKKTIGSKSVKKRPKTKRR